MKNNHLEMILIKDWSEYEFLEKLNNVYTQLYTNKDEARENYKEINNYLRFGNIINFSSEGIRKINELTEKINNISLTIT